MIVELGLKVKTSQKNMTNNQLNTDTQALQEKAKLGSVNTQRAYQADWKLFEAYCLAHNHIALPATPITIANYLASGRQYAWHTLQRKLAAIRKQHSLAGFVENPCNHPLVIQVLEGWKREKGIDQKQSAAFSMNYFKQTLANFPETCAGLRDKTILLLGLAGAFRRSELVALNIEDIQVDDDFVVLRIKQSKTNQYQDKEYKLLAYSADIRFCPVRNLQKWKNLLGRETGALFVSINKADVVSEQRICDKTVYLLTKKYLGNKYSAHSLRASFVTIAKLNGADDQAIMNQTGHKTVSMIRKYTRIQSLKDLNAVSKLGL
jgi:site-specific recombinase XerD